MSKKFSIIILGVFLVAGFLVFNASDAQACTLKTANWSKTSVNLGDSVDLVIGADGSDCMGKTATLDIWERLSGLDQKKATLNAVFNNTGVSVAATAKTTWKTERGTDSDASKYEFYFVAKVDSSTKESNSLFVSVVLCKLTGASWSKQTILVGEKVNMNVTGQNCNRWEVSFNIWEDDTWPNPDDFITTVNATFDSGGGRARAQWTIDASKAGNESSYEFYFIAVAGEAEQQSSNLNVPAGEEEGEEEEEEAQPCLDPEGEAIPCPPDEDQEVVLELENPIAAESLVDLAKAIGRFLFQIAIPIAVIVIIYAGILFLTSQGKPEQINKAKTVLLYAVIGLAVILIGQGFFTLIKSILDLGRPGP